MDESLLRLDFKGCRVAITADRHRIEVPSPIQVGADYQRSCSRWVTDAYPPLEVIFVELRHFCGGVTKFKPCDPGNPSVSSISRLHQTRAAQPFRRVICAPTE